MTVLDAVREHREEILRIAAQHRATNVRVFGSVARGTAGADSDLDLLVDVTGETTPWFPCGLIVDLEELVGAKVDIAEEATLHRRIRDRVLAEARPLEQVPISDPDLFPVRDQGVYFEQILECVEHIQLFTAGRPQSFVEDRMTQDAVMRNLQVLSESCMRMSSEIRERRKEIDWKRIAAFRNVVVHDDLDLDLERIWEIIQTDLPPLAAIISEELARVDAELQEKGQEGHT